MSPPQQTAMTPGDLSWVVQGQSRISGVLFLLGLTRSFFLSYCSKMLKLLCVFVGHGEPLAQGQARGCEACSCQLHLPLSHASSGCPPGLISSLEPGFTMGQGRWGPWVHWSLALAPWRAGRWGRGCTSPPRPLCFPHWIPQVRLERIRQAESLEQVRSIVDEAPLRDIRDIKDT